MAKNLRKKRHRRRPTDHHLVTQFKTNKEMFGFTAQRPFVSMESMKHMSRKREIVHLSDGTVRTTRYDIWHNQEYAVAVYEPHFEGGPIHVTIQRFDEQPARDWRHLQQIKNEVCGPNFEALELYPSQDRVVDMTNTTHLWVYEKLAVGMYPPDEDFVAVVASETE